MKTGGWGQGGRQGEEREINREFFNNINLGL